MTPGNNFRFMKIINSFSQHLFTTELNTQNYKILHEDVEGDKTYSAAFLRVSQVFGKVYEMGLLNKFKKLVPIRFRDLLTPYALQRMFSVKQEGEYSEMRFVKSIKYLLYMSD